MSNFTAEQLEQPFYSRHFGPFRLVLTRPHKTKPEGFFQTEWTTGELDGEDVETEALELLADKRDTIVGVDIWSVREQMFVYSYPDKRSIEV